MNLITTPAQVGYIPVATAIVHSTTASLTSRAPVQPVHLVQYDQTMPVIAVALTANGQPYTVPSGAAVNVRMDKPDGTHVYDPALGVSTDGQTAYIGITAQMTAAAGSSSPIVEIIVNEGVAGTAAFPVIIDPNPVPDSAYESTDEYLTLYEILQQAQSAAQIVHQNAQNLQNVTDNLEAIQNAAANAQAAAHSAQEAQTAAQQALGFRTFFSAVSPDENGDLDPSRPMTTPSAQASWTIKSKGDRIQSVQIDGFTTQSGTGDPSPTNVRAISTAGIWMLEALFDGSGDEYWTAFGGAPGTFFTDVQLPSATDPFNGYASRLIFYNGGNISQLPQNSYAIQRPIGKIRFIIRVNNTTTNVSDCRAYLSENPVVLWVGVDDKADATGLYVPIQAQGHEYRCQMLELTEPLCDGDKVESNVPNGCDKKIVLDGSVDEVWTQSPSAPTWFTCAISFDYSLIYASYLPNGGSQVSNAPQNSFVLVGTSIYINIDGVSNVSDLKSRLSQKPLTFFVRSTSYTEDNDIPVALEEHTKYYHVFDGTENIVGYTDLGTVARVFVKDMPSIPTKYAGCICNAFKTDTAYTGDYEHCYANKEPYLFIDKSRLSEQSNAGVKSYFASLYSSGTPIVMVYELATPAVYAHDPVTLVAVPYTEADTVAAQQLANTPSTLPYIDSADVPMLLDSIGMPEADVEVQPDGTLDAENTRKAEEWIQETAQRLMAAPLASALPVAGTYVVSSQNGTTVLVSLKAMQDGGDAATLGGMTLEDIKVLISSMIADANK